MTYWYLGTPYSQHRFGMEFAFKEACRQTALLIRAGVPVFSPIAHTHPIAIYGRLPQTDHAIWLQCDRPMMDAARGMIVCKMDGWEDSFGVAHEIDVFRNAHKPVIYMVPGTVPAEVQP